MQLVGRMRSGRFLYAPLSDLTDIPICTWHGSVSKKMFVFKSNILLITGLTDQKGLLSLNGNVQQTPAHVRIREASNSKDNNIFDCH
jgi:hypothetical protein